MAGSHDTVHVHDVIDRQVVLELLPEFRFPTNNFVRHTQGKPRIRLLDQKVDSHVYLILAAILLLPKPKREIGATPGGKLQIYRDNFSVMSIPFDLVELTNNELVISPTRLILSNSTSDSVRLDVIERLRIVMACWEAASKSDSPIANAVLQHRSAFNNKDVKAMMATAKSLRIISGAPDDPLRHITKDLALSNLEELMWLGVYAADTDEALAFGEVNFEELKEAARNRIKVWRQVTSRGAGGAKFSADIREAYDHTCLFTGMRLPKIPAIGSSGVDAAHILPWAEYDLNAISNGLCLSKLCHWAFDSGILRLNFHPQSSEYLVQLSPAALTAEAAGLLKLGELKSIQGTISTSLLPKDSANWPNPTFLNVYNDALNF